MIRWFRRIGLGVLILLLLVLVLVVVNSYRLVAGLDPDAPPQAAVLLDREGQFFAYAGWGAVRRVSLDEVPLHLQQAVVAAEDKRFYQHRGVDLIAIGRAIWANLRAGSIVQGASTITQQLARTLFLTTEQTLSRKVQEMVLALFLEQRFSKEEILEMYLNRYEFGEGAVGVDAASRTYFGRPPEQLHLGQSALLAGILQGPYLYSPFRNLDGALARQAYVLDRMVEDGYVTREEAAAAREAPLQLAQRPSGGERYVTDWIRSELVRRLGSNLVRYGGLVVQTTIDPQVQAAMEGILGEHQGAIVALDPQTGGVLGLVGGRSYRESQWNRATLAVRQPGSALKPIIYAAALEQGWQPNWLVDDRPHRFGEYAPENYKDEYWGPVTLRQALVDSLNNGSVWLLSQIGVEAGIEMARRLGLSRIGDADRHLGLVLGALAEGVTPLELAAAYAVFANGGYRVEPHGIIRVQDAQGRVWIEEEPDPRLVLSPQIAYLITDMLRGVVETGTGTAAWPGRPAAGKTGTSDDLVNAWFVGYTPELVAAVYLGNDDGSPIAGGGGTLAAPLWGRFITRALAHRPVQAFTPPPGVVPDVLIDPFTGLRASERCPRAQPHALLRSQVPSRYAPCTWGAPQGEGLPASRAAFERGEVTVAAEPGRPRSGSLFPLLLPQAPRPQAPGAASERDDGLPRRPGSLSDLLRRLLLPEEGPEAEASPETP